MGKCRHDILFAINYNARVPNEPWLKMILKYLKGTVNSVFQFKNFGGYKGIPVLIAMDDSEFGRDMDAKAVGGHVCCLNIGETNIDDESFWNAPFWTKSKKQAHVTDSVGFAKLHRDGYALER
jgi:hypothetical protein